MEIYNKWITAYEVLRKHNGRERSFNIYLELWGIYNVACMLRGFSHVELLWPMDYSSTRLLSPWAFQVRYWLSCYALLQRTFLNPWIECLSPAYPCIPGRFFSSEPPEKPFSAFEEVWKTGNSSPVTPLLYKLIVTVDYSSGPHLLKKQIYQKTLLFQIAYT